MGLYYVSLRIHLSKEELQQFCSFENFIWKRMTIVNFRNFGQRVIGGEVRGKKNSYEDANN